MSVGVMKDLHTSYTLFIMGLVCLLWIDKTRDKDKTYVGVSVRWKTFFVLFERPKAKTEESTLLGYTGFHGELEHRKIKIRLIDEKFVSVMCECVFVKL